MKKIILPVLLCVFTFSCDKSNSRKPRLNQENIKGVEKNDAPTGDGNWFIQDPTINKVEGVSSNKAITEFSLKNERTIVVAVIDSGVDVNHEDLKGKIWENPGEMGVDAQGNNKATNGIDDDKDGYIDDVHGWNFLGGKNGKSISNETLEVTREMLRYDNKIAAGESLTDEEKTYFEKVKIEYTQLLDDANKEMAELSPLQVKVAAAKSLLKDQLKLEDLTKEKLEAITSTDKDILEAKKTLLEVIQNFRSVARFERIYASTKNTLDFYLNKKFNPRAEIVGDDPSNFEDKNYGNNDVRGPDASHGTHVSGIIAAVRGNKLGIDGVAENVKIMVLRVVPDGDERDKDVALAVKYAADHGAHVINMSFGKGYSPNKAKVDEAFLYAASKNVLLFHAAGNSASNNDVNDNFPNSLVQDAIVKKLSEKIPTWIEVGASSKEKSYSLPAVFSNYGKKNVDLFSPGVDLNSTTPDNTYSVYSGTSMASPCAAGVGALLLSNFKAMTALQAKALLLNQTRHYDGLDVHLPGSEALDLPVPFAGLSATGGIIDAYASVSLAKKLSGQ